ncbi:MAG: hypothetical protein AAF654_04710 [Myxococcota bacterium]
MSVLLITAFVSAGLLDEAETKLKEFDAQHALRLLDQVKADGPLTLEDSIRLYASAGIAYAYLDRNDERDAAFHELLLLDPSHVLPYTLAPRVTFGFERMRQKLSVRPAVEMSWPRGRRVGEDVPVVIEVLRDPNQRFARAVLHWREGVDGEYTTARLQLPDPGAYTTVTLPAHADDVRTDQIRQLYLSVFDGQGNEIWRVADARQPREISFEYVEPIRWYERWWVWTAVGTVLAASTAALVIRNSRAPADAIDLGVEIRP